MQLDFGIEVIIRINAYIMYVLGLIVFLHKNILRAIYLHTGVVR